MRREVVDARRIEDDEIGDAPQEKGLPADSPRSVPGTRRRPDDAEGDERNDGDGEDRRWQRDVSAELALRGFVIARFP